MNALGHQDLPMFIGVKNVDVKFSRMKPQTYEKIPLNCLQAHQRFQCDVKWSSPLVYV